MIDGSKNNMASEPRFSVELNTGRNKNYYVDPFFVTFKYGPVSYNMSLREFGEIDPDKSYKQVSQELVVNEMRMSEIERLLASDPFVLISTLRISTVLDSSNSYRDDNLREKRSCYEYCEIYKSSGALDGRGTSIYDTPLSQYISLSQKDGKIHLTCMNNSCSQSKSDINFVLDFTPENITEIKKLLNIIKDVLLYHSENIANIKGKWYNSGIRREEDDDW